MTNILMSRSSALVESYAYPYLKEILKPNMKALVIGFSFFGNLTEEVYEEYYGLNSEYREKIESNFNQYNIKDVDWIYYYNQSKEEMVKLINDADILYFPGGAPDLMYERIIEKDILKPLEEFKGIVIGSSAGAMIQLGMYHISKDNEYFKFSLNKGLGYINDFFIEVHYRRRKKQNSSMRKIRKTYKKPVYTIPDDGMVIVSDNKVLTLGTAKKYYNKKGINK